MSPQASDAKNRHIEKAISYAKKKASDGEARLLEDFIRHYYSAVAGEDLLQRGPAELASAALAHFEFASKRTPGKPSIRIYNPTTKTHGYHSTHTVVEMVNDDMPFLVDSASMALNKHGYSIHLTIHPIFKAMRDKRGRLEQLVAPHDDLQGAQQESFIRIEIDKETEKSDLAALEAELHAYMSDVNAAVNDWAAMRGKASEIINLLSKQPPKLEPSEVTEGIKFLDWLVNNHFTFLGYREYDLVRENDEDVLKAVPESGLGILRNSANKSQSFMVLPKDIREKARAKELLIITKANSVSTVHRPSYLDYIGVKRFNEAGEVIGERRFLGLFTSSAYSRSPRDIPLLRQKVEQVMLRSRLPFNSHAGKALLHILETFPRDELFQASTDELFGIATGVQQLQERQHVKVFIRRDSFGRYFSCLIYVPRDRYNTQVREKIQDLLKDRLNGTEVESSAQISESVLARVHMIVRTTPWQFPEYDIAAIEDELAEIVRSWQDKLRDAGVDMYGEEKGLKLFHRFGEYLPAAYREDVKPKAAAFDLAKMHGLTDDRSLHMSLYKPQHNPQGLWRFKIFHAEQPLPISDVLPMLENMGLKVISERPYEVDLTDGSIVWIQDFDIIYDTQRKMQPEDVKEIFQDTFASVWLGRAENDGFNRLVLGANLDWRQVALMRAYCKYLLQSGIPFSQAYMEQALINNTEITRKLIELFETRFAPRKAKGRDKAADGIIEEIRTALDSVASLDDDRILRAFLNLINATLRTNYYQPDGESQEPKEYISFKFDPQSIPELPLPKPAFEIWVYSPRVEGVHLRGGKVARGGLRWSDRREDFRTEILGLMKAQQVKNTLIVPVGSKGGFVVKRPPAGGDREAFMKEGVECYRTFLRGLLDLTDNIVEGRIEPPKHVVRHDEDDPYLVVAADKGTATFSDIANGVAAEYGFWLGDAFASGGSVGYDHKKMGITARGAWESVKRHFREMGVDTQTTNFSVVGIGDMAGDVFGNGMLLSRHIKLKAAFNHMHIFIDPFPEPEASFQERERLFNLPRSTWEDYNPELISKGGGVYSRSAKSIKLSAEAREALGIEETVLTPNELIKAILKAPVDLLWNGGIGTYVKAKTESNSDVGDRANDSVRVNGEELRCRVVGEGGNLGLTQLGRIEFALKGGRVNTDFVDNSGGVDCSDHEVNIKILLNHAQNETNLTLKQRNKLLADMTDEVAQLVLRDNYLQTQAITVAEAQAPARINEHAYLMRTLERAGLLNRSLEFLPGEEALAERRAANRGLTRPEIAVLFAYAKMDVYDSLLNSDVPEDSYLSTELENYFPKPLQRRYRDLMPEHRLKREIVATAITNSMVHRMGPTFPHRMREETGAEPAAIARAYTIAREAYDMRTLWTEIESLDNKIPATLQTAMNVQIARLLKHATHWLLDRPENSADIAKAVNRFAPAIRSLGEVLEKVLGPVETNAFADAVQQYVDLGVPAELARRIASLRPLYAALDIADIAEKQSMEVGTVAAAYFHIESRLDLSWLREEIEKLSVDGHWQAIARGTLRDNLYSQQRRITALALRQPKKGAMPMEVVNTWLAEREQRVQHAQRVLADMRTAGSLDFATASVALQEIRKIS